jgi:hypothetical protein
MVLLQRCWNRRAFDHHLFHQKPLILVSRNFSFMKVFFLIMVLTFFSCRAFQKKQEVDICGSSNFYQKVEKVTFDDAHQIKKLNGKFVEIEGFLHANFEDNALYPSKSSHSMDALWLNSKLPDSLLNLVNGKKVKVIGRVNLLDKGHLNGYLATLDSTFCIMEVMH